MAASTNYDVIGEFLNAQQSGPSNGLAACISGSASTAIGAATKYLSAAGTATASTTPVVLFVAPVACTIKNLWINAVTAAGGTDTGAAAVYASTDNGGTWAATALTCTVTGTAKAASDVTHAVAVAAGSLLALGVVSSAGTLAGLSASFQVFG